MFHYHLLGILFIVRLAKWLIKEHTEPITPATTRFDWDAYRDDISRMSVKDRMKKVERGGYYITK